MLYHCKATDARIKSVTLPQPQIPSTLHGADSAQFHYLATRSLILVVVRKAQAQFLVAILPTKRSNIKHQVRIHQLFNSPCIRRVCVEHILPLLQEDAHSRLLSSRMISHPTFLQLVFALKVVFHRCNTLILCDFEVVVEVCAIGRVPRKLPAHTLLECFNLGDWRTRHSYEGCVARIKVAQVGDVIAEVGTRGAAFVFVGAEHKVVDQKLLATFEEILERDFAGWTFECVVFCEFDHG